MNAYGWSAVAVSALAGFAAGSPSGRVLVIRRLRWELGERRLVVRSLAGLACLTPAVGAVLASRYGLLIAGLILPLGMATGLALMPARRIKSAWRAREALRAARMSACEACEVIASELRAGRTPGQALRAGAAVLPALGPAADAATAGGDVVAALAGVRVPGASGLRSLSAAWAVAEASGAGLALVVDRLAAGLRDEQETRDEVSAALAAPRSTAKVLAALPLAGVALGYGMGADPLVFLLGTPAGLACLAVGCGLALSGLAWVERLARSAEDRT